MRSASRWATSLACCLLLGTCTPASPPAETDPGAEEPIHRGGAATVLFVGAPATLDPYSDQADDTTRFLASPVYPSLYVFDPRGRPHPALAADLTPVRGGVRVRLERVRWSSGRRVVARDVVRSVRRARPPSGFAGLRARAVDRVTVELRGRRGDWAAALATAAYVLPGGRSRRNSAGPYRITSYERGLEVVFERNRRWAGEPGYLDGVTVRFAASLDIAIRLLERGEADAAALPYSVNLGDRVEARGLEHGTALGWESVWLDLTQSGLARSERRAIAGAIDRTAAAQGFLRGHGRESTTLAPEPGDDRAGGRFERAFEGRTPSATLRLGVPAGDELLGYLSGFLEEQFEHEGMDVEVVTAPLEELHGGATGAGLLLRRTRGGSASAATRRAERRLDGIPLLHVPAFIARHEGLRGVDLNPTLAGPLWDIETWWRDE